MTGFVVTSCDLSRAAFAGAPVALALLAASCAVATPRVDAEGDVARALATPDAVVFRTERDALDSCDAPSRADALTLADALRSAVAASPELQSALARVHAARADAELAGTPPNPVLDLVLRAPSGGGAVEIEAGLAADLVAWLERPRRASAAAHRLRAEAARALATALDVVASTRELYARAQTAEELVPLLERRLAAFDRTLAVARARFELGEGARSESSAIESERASLALERDEALRDLRVARTALARRVGAPSSTAVWTLDPWRAPADVPLDEAAWIRAALASRPELAAAEAELAARADESALASGDAWRGASIGVDAERADGWSAGPALAAPLPLFDDGSARGRRARALEVEARHRATELARAAVEDVRAALAVLASDTAALARLEQELVPLAERRRAETEAAFAVGELDVVALLASEEALHAAHARRIELERDVSAAIARLERAAGGRASADAVSKELGRAGR